MITKLPFLTYTAIFLIAFNAEADQGDSQHDLAWGATTGGNMVKIDATTGQLVSISYNGTPYSTFQLLTVPTGMQNGRPNNVRLGSSLWIAQNSNSTLYGVDNNGTLYTISPTLSADQNGDVGFIATATLSLNSPGINLNAAVWISATLLDIVANQSLYQYNLTTQQVSYVGSFNNIGISGLAFNGALYGVQYSPSPGGIDLISGVNLAALKNSTINGLSGGSSSFAGASLLYVSDGNNSFYSYDTAKNKLTAIPNNFPGGIHSLTPFSVSGGGGTPTPTPTATPTPSPTATPKITYSLPTGTMTVNAPETTPQGSPECAPSYNYSVTESSAFAQGATIDPTGTIGIYRYYQTTSNGTSYLPVTALAAVPASTVWAWTSGSTNTHPAITYTAGQVGTTGTPFYYGREVLTLVYSSPKNGTNTVLDTKTIYQYPWIYNSQTIAPTASFSNGLTGVSDQAASNPSPYASPFPSPSPVFQGDVPRFTVQMNNLYPAGASSVMIYPGTPISNPGASGSAVIPITATTTPNNGLYTTAAPITFEVAQYINTAATTAQTYTIAAIQTLPSGYATSTTAPNLNPAILQTLTFMTTPVFNINGTVGTVK